MKDKTKFGLILILFTIAAMILTSSYTTESTDEGESEYITSDLQLIRNALR